MPINKRLDLKYKIKIWLIELHGAYASSHFCLIQAFPSSLRSIPRRLKTEASIIYGLVFLWGK